MYSFYETFNKSAWKPSKFFHMLTFFVFCFCISVSFAALVCLCLCQQYIPNRNNSFLNSFQGMSLLFSFFKVSKRKQSMSSFKTGQRKRKGEREKEREADRQTQTETGRQRKTNRKWEPVADFIQNTNIRNHLLPCQRILPSEMYYNFCIFKSPPNKINSFSIFISFYMFTFGHYSSRSESISSQRYFDKKSHN